VSLTHERSVRQSCDSGLCGPCRGSKVRDREEPFHQWQPAVQVAFDVGVVDLEVDALLFDRRGVLVGEQREVGADAGAEPGELQGEVEPPAWVALSEEDHQHGCAEQAGGDATARMAHHLTAAVVDRLGGPSREHSADNRNWNDQDPAEERRHPVVLVRVVDLKTRRVG